MLSHEPWAGIGRYTRGYVASVAQGVAELRDRADRFELVPLGVPASIFPAWVPLDQAQLVELFSLAPTSTPGAARRFAFDDTGRLRDLQALYVDVIDLAGADTQR